MPTDRPTYANGARPDYSTGQTERLDALVQPLCGLSTAAKACQQWLRHDPPNLEELRVLVDRIVEAADQAAALVTHR